ncbi:MMPL family protein [Rubripirellula lacrimiformis]|uniref:MMPL family protein n=1 Tax=Rubripirellula lacrimiformis TaxID=1930273 RepID=A0A517NFU4_9BACT|nr:MMPL family transporter [Rubripirellula lacrimiformis]QDT06012.1 MMPL family protein [Rubripirellula lacrimiformis]
MRYRYAIALVGIVIGWVAWPLAGRVDFDRSISAMFAEDDPTLVAYRELESAFGGNAVVMLVYEDSQFTTTEGMARNESLSQRVEAVAGVRGVLSPAVLNRAVQKIRPAGLFSRTPPLFRKSDSVSRGFMDLFAGYTHSADQSRAAVVAILEPGHDQGCIETLQQIATELENGELEQGDLENGDLESGDQAPGDAASANQASGDAADTIGDVALVGEPVLVHDGFQLIERDGSKLETMTLALLSIVLAVAMRDLRLIVLAAGVITWSVTVTKALLFELGVELSLVSTILTAVVTVICVTAILHFGVRFQANRRRGRSRLTATVGAMSGLAAPIFWTCATDAAGFAALSISRILPVQQFGIMIAIASMAVFVALALFAPVLMMIPTPGEASKAAARGSERSADRSRNRKSRLDLKRWGLMISSLAIGRRGLCAVTTVIVIVVIGVGLGKAEVETSFLNNFRSDSVIVADYDRVETNFGGAGVWDIILDAPQVLTEEYLRSVRDLTGQLRDIDVDGARLTKVISLADADAVALRVRLLRLVSPATRLSGMQVTMPVFFAALLSDGNAGEESVAAGADPDASEQQTETGAATSQAAVDADTEPGSMPRRFRIMLRSNEQLDADHKTALIDEVRRVVAASDVGASGRVTGYYVLMTQLVGQMVGDQWRCFAASGLLVWILLIMATRSPKLATAALAPNLLPVFLVLALVGIMGGKINMGAAMIAAVSIGLSIDGSVHFLSAYQRFRRRGHSANTSAIHAAGNIGTAVFLATIALVVGFGAMMTSQFVPTATFGILVAATLVLGTIVNLTLLPALVSAIDP